MLPVGTFNDLPATSLPIMNKITKLKTNMTLVFCFYWLPGTDLNRHSIV